MLSTTKEKTPSGQVGQCLPVVQVLITGSNWPELHYKTLPQNKNKFSKSLLFGGWRESMYFTYTHVSKLQSNIIHFTLIEPMYCFGQFVFYPEASLEIFLVLYHVQVLRAAQVMN